MIDKLDAAILENIINQAGIIAYVDEFGNYKYVNKRWEKETEILAKHAIGRNAEELLSGSGAMLALRTGRTISGEMFIRTINGKEISAIMKYQPIFNNEKNVEGCLISSVFENMDEARGFSDRLEQILEEFDYLESEEKKSKNTKYDINSIIGNSRAIAELKEQIYIAGSSNASCLIEGETGTGKELVAHAIHNVSRRSLFPFIRVNCSAIPENLMESEFFGYEEGSFTGSVKGGKAGKFEKAHLGSMFLDEINAMNLSMQPKLLRALQEKEIERIGGAESIPVSVRVIAASNMPLDMLVDEGKFRRDLYYRLNIITIRIPPLRERKEDIMPLVESFIRRYNVETNRNVKEISGDAIEYLMDYDWPGNVRELQNVIERTMASTWKETLNLSDFKRFNSHDSVFGKNVYAHHENNIKQNVENELYGASLSEQKERSERDAIIKALEQAGYNKAKAARMLNISRTLLYKKLEKYNLS